MNIAQPTLDGWRATVERLHTLISSALVGVRAGHPGMAERRLERAQEEVTRLAALLDRAGALPPPDAQTPPAVPTRSLDTTANRYYAEALRQAWLAALAVDQERYGKDVGTDGRALVLELMLRDVEAELRG